MDTLQLRGFNLPTPESKLIVCGDTVFKIKTRPVSKNGEVSNLEYQFKHDRVQSDLKRIVGGLLQLILDNSDLENPPLKPVYSDCIVVYPQITGPWSVADQLRFFCNNVELKVYQKIIQFFVEVKAASLDNAQPQQPASCVAPEVAMSSYNQDHIRKRSPIPQTSHTESHKRVKYSTSEEEHHHHHDQHRHVRHADERVAAMPRAGRGDYPHQQQLSEAEIRKRYLEEEKRLRNLQRHV
ncbi:uncharacterized protein [Dysidea avara]|uniref:uncharacterized protein n=1 Tax=Dysidea avara TaxID=196820 RepID=UPI00331A29D8